MTHPSVAPVLSVRDLAIALPPGGDRVHAVAHISFDVPPGKIVCLLGESGSGKSVIANAVMGLLPPGLVPVRGVIELQGENLLAAPQGRLRALRGPAMAMVFQEPMTALNPVMTCGAQVDEMLAQHVRMGAAERRQKILAIMARVRLPEPERIYASYPHQLSGGQRQRAMIAMALACKPRLLIADEPTTALDVTVQQQVLDLLASIRAADDVALMLISHDVAVVGQVCDRVLVMYAGKIVEDLSAEDLATTAQHPYTRALVAAVPDMDTDLAQPLAVIPGRPVDPADVPVGCAYAARCPLATDRCRAQDPPLETDAAGRRVACWRAGEPIDIEIQDREQVEVP
jgi:peptide/nickel transport system ATP-binding protein